MLFDLSTWQGLARYAIWVLVLYLGPLPLAFAGWHIYRQRTHWLSYHVNRLLEEHDPELIKLHSQSTGILRCLQEILLQKWGLAIFALSVVICHFVFILVLEKFEFDSWLGMSGWADFVAALWQVHATILGVTFVVIVFVVDKIKSGLNRDDLFNIYLRESAILAIAIWGLVILLLLGATNIMFAQPGLPAGQHLPLALPLVVQSALFLVATGCLYWKTLQMLRPSWIAEARMRHVREVIARVVMDDVSRALGQRILRRLYGELGLHLGAPDSAGCVLRPIDAGHEGQVLDVNLERLCRFARMLRERIQLPFDHGVVKAIIRPTVGFELHSGSTTLAWIIPDDASAKSRRMLRSAFKIVGRPPAEYSLSDELDELSGAAHSALHSRNSSLFEKIMQQYLTLFETATRASKAYSVVASEAVRTDPVMGAPGFLWAARSDIYSIIEESIQSGERAFIRDAMHLPAQLMHMAINMNDENLYRSACEYMREAYALVRQDIDNRSRNFVIDQSWRHLSESVRFFISLKLRNDSICEHEIRRLGRYVSIVMSTFTDLLKASIDFGDAGSFEQFGKGLDDLLEYYRPEDIIADYHVLDYYDRGQNSDSAPDGYVAELARFRAYRSIRDQYEADRQEIWFGVAGWLVRAIAGEQRTPSVNRMLAQAREHFRDLTEFSLCFYQYVLRENGGGISKWEHWVISEFQDNKFHTIDTSSWLRLFYCIQGLRLTPNKIPDGSDTPILPCPAVMHAHDSLVATIQELEEKKHLWNGILTEEDLGRKDNFLELNRRAARKEEEKQAWQIIDQPISDAKWTQYRMSFLRGWQESSGIRMIIEKAGCLKYALLEEERSRACQGYGMGIDLPRSLLVEPSPPGLGLGLGTGHEAGGHESAIALELLSAKISSVESVSEESLVDKVSRTIQSLSAQGYTPDVVLIDWRIDLFRLARDRSSFVPSWAAGCEELRVPGFEGRLNGIPVIRIALTPGRIIVADLSRLGRWIQYTPSGSSQDVWSFDLKEIDEEAAGRWLDEDPDIMQRLGVETRDQAIWKLRQRVHLRTTQWFEYIVEDPSAAIVLDVADMDQANATE